MPDPTPAEIEAARRAFLDAEHDYGCVWCAPAAPCAAHGVAAALRAVLPDVEARVRAQVAEEIAQALDQSQCLGAHFPDVKRSINRTWRLAAHVARQHATREEPDHA